MYDDFVRPATKTTNGTSYVSCIKLSNLHSRTFTVVIKENNVNSIKYKILASIDDVVYLELQPETQVAKNGSDYQSFEGAWRFVDVQIAAVTSGQDGDVTVTVSGI